MIPVLYVGPPGIGKTAKVKERYDHVEVLLLSSSAEEDISGLPFLKDGEEERTVPKFIRSLQKADREGKTTCLFLDELDKARRDVADTLLSLVVDPVSFGVPKNTVLLAAANPEKWGGGDGISDAMLSRWCIHGFDMDRDYIENLKEFWRKRYSGHPNVLKIADEILDLASTRGLIEVTGENLLKRLTCPRTLTMAMDFCVSPSDGLSQEKVAGGLLTPVFASVFSEKKKYERMRNGAKKALKVSRKPLKKVKKQTGPTRRKAKKTPTGGHGPSSIDKMTVYLSPDGEIIRKDDPRHPDYTL